MRRVSDRTILLRKVAPDFARGAEPTVRIVDLFCGCGGMTLGAAQAAHVLGSPVEIPLAVDLDAAALRVFRSNFPRANTVHAGVESVLDGRLGEVLTARERGLRRRVDVLRKPIDLLLGGPPCQGNSDLNNHTRRSDPRNQLYSRMARAARVLQPRFVVVENVPAVVHDRGGVVDQTRQCLEDLGYETASTVASLTSLGVPQARRRHLLLAVRAGSHVSAESTLGRLGTSLQPRTVEWAIADLRGKSGEPGNGFDSPSRATLENKQRIDWLFENRSYVLDDSMRPPCHRDKKHSYKSIYGRMRWDQPAQTITTGFGSMGQGCYVHPDERRTITPHEAARLQTFPDHFSFEAAGGRTAMARLIGNAVPPFLLLKLGLLLFGPSTR